MKYLLSRLRAESFVVMEVRLNLFFLDYHWHQIILVSSLLLVFISGCHKKLKTPKCRIHLHCVLCWWQIPILRWGTPLSSSALIWTNQQSANTAVSAMFRIITISAELSLSMQFLVPTPASGMVINEVAVTVISIIFFSLMWCIVYLVQGDHLLPAILLEREREMEMWFSEDCWLCR